MSTDVAVGMYACIVYDICNARKSPIWTADRFMVFRPNKPGIEHVKGRLLRGKVPRKCFKKYSSFQKVMVVDMLNRNNVLFSYVI